MPGRPDDAFGVGWSRIDFGDTFIPFLLDTLGLGLKDEDAVELYYNVAVTRWLDLRASRASERASTRSGRGMIETRSHGSLTIRYGLVVQPG